MDRTRCHDVVRLPPRPRRKLRRLLWGDEAADYGPFEDEMDKSHAVVEERREQREQAVLVITEQWNAHCRAA